MPGKHRHPGFTQDWRRVCRCALAALGRRPEDDANVLSFPFPDLRMDTCTSLKVTLAVFGVLGISLLEKAETGKT